MRALFALLVVLPLYYLKRLIYWPFGQRQYPLSLIGSEIRGSLTGAWALWRSRQRVRQQGRSTPYTPVAQRDASAAVEPLVSSRELHYPYVKPH
ncbi:MAG: hypothetical protein F6K28_60930 [Microcoleus sp. SIO2G3]|nr:hypothetical protein [Microcoleus sp. SIO2G3]